MNTKHCPTCKKCLDYSNFGKNKTKSDGLQSICKKCRCEYQNNHYKNNSNYYKENAKKTRTKYRDWFKDFKKTLSCKQCGENHPACLQFHHKDPNTKKFEISNGICRKGRNLLLKEIEKCDILCANCHAKLHYKEKIADMV